MGSAFCERHRSGKERHRTDSDYRDIVLVSLSRMSADSDTNINFCDGADGEDGYCAQGCATIIVAPVPDIVSHVFIVISRAEDCASNNNQRNHRRW